MTTAASTTTATALLLAQVRELFGRLAYTHKVHEKQADICFTNFRRQQGALVVLTAISSGTFLTALAGTVSPKISGLVTSFVAVLVTAVGLAAKHFTFAEDARAHRNVAAELWNLRESYLSLLTDLMSGAIADDDARARRDELQAATSAAYAEAPRTTAKAFEKASKGLKSAEELTFAPEEIDAFLPEAMRLTTLGEAHA